MVGAYLSHGPLLPCLHRMAIMTFTIEQLALQRLIMPGAPQNLQASSFLIEGIVSEEAQEVRIDVVVPDRPPSGNGLPVTPPLGFLDVAPSPGVSALIHYPTGADDQIYVPSFGIPVTAYGTYTGASPNIWAMVYVPDIDRYYPQTDFAECETDSVELNSQF